MGIGGKRGISRQDWTSRPVMELLGYRICDLGLTIAGTPIERAVATLRDESGYDARRAEIDAFNRASRTQLRGLAISGVKFGISFTRRTLNQANAIVNIYLDGSVMVSLGGHTLLCTAVGVPVTFLSHPFLARGGHALSITPPPP